MGVTDSDEERQRLTAFYRGLVDEELEKLAQEAASLTEVARAVLADEIARRGLDLPLNTVMDVVETEFRPLVTVRQFRDLPEALMAKGMLDGAGIESFIG